MKSKKLLSIVLALVLVLSMGTIMVSANDTPQPSETSVYTEAADFSNAGISKTLKVANGLSLYPKTYSVAFVKVGSDTAAAADHPDVATVNITVGNTPSDNEVTGTKTFDQIFTPALLSSFPHAGEYVYSFKETTNSETSGFPKTEIIDGDEHIRSLTMDTAEYKVHVFVANGADGLEYNGLYVETVVTGGTGEKVDPTIVRNEHNHDISGANFENSYFSEISKNDGLIVVTKTITGDYADKTKKFKVSVSVTLPEGATREQITLPAGSGATVTGTAPNFTISKDLADGETLKINALPAGTTWTVGETQANGYKSKITGGAVTTADTAFVEGDRSGVACETVNAAHLAANDGRLQVGIENNMETSTPTGVIIESLPWLLLVLAAAAGAVYFILKKRTSREQ